MDSTRVGGIITPQEQRLLIAAQTRVNNLNTRLAANKNKIRNMKEKIVKITNEIRENNDVIVRLEQEEDDLRIQFVEAKLLYELEFRKKQISEKEARHLFHCKVEKVQEELKEGWNVMKMAIEDEKLEAKMYSMIGEVNTITHQVSELENIVNKYDRRLSM